MSGDQRKLDATLDLLTLPTAFGSIFKEIKQQLQRKCIDYAKSVAGRTDGQTADIKINILCYATFKKCQEAKDEEGEDKNELL